MVMAERSIRPPHPELPAYYNGASAKSAYLRDLFDDAAPDYDRIEHLMALGSGPWYRRQALHRAGLKPGMSALDVATGTGLVAREALAIVGPGGRVVGVDPSAGMLNGATGRPAASCAVRGVGEQLPFADGSFDFLSMGYALRHLGDLNAAFTEFRRVLKPGGRLCILEITRPNGFAGRHLLAAYFKMVLPILLRFAGRASQRSRLLWRYYWDTIDRCVAPAIILQSLGDTGFTDARRHRSIGLFSEYTAIRGE